MDSPPRPADLGGPSPHFVAAREKLGLTQKEVADKLFLTTTFIKYIDEGEFDKIPKPAFIKGYLRSYARVVELSGDEMVALYEAALTAGEPEAEIRGVTEESVGTAAITGPVLQTGLIGLAGLALIVGIVWWAGSSDEEAPPPVVTSPVMAVSSELRRKLLTVRTSSTRAVTPSTVRCDRSAAPSRHAPRGHGRRRGSTPSRAPPT